MRTLACQLVHSKFHLKLFRCMPLAFPGTEPAPGPVLSHIVEVISDGV